MHCDLKTTCSDECVKKQENFEFYSEVYQSLMDNI